MNDPIADMLTRIRNGLMVRKKTVAVPHSKLKVHVLDNLKKMGYILGYKVDKSGAFPELHITLSSEKEVSKLSALERISKPGRRVYAKSYEIPVIRNGQGDVIISTSQGLMTGREARKRKLGGELICKVY